MSPSVLAVQLERFHRTFDDPDIEETMRSYSRKLRAYFARQAELLGYHYRDLTPALAHAAARSNADELLYFRTNVHLTAAGHRVVSLELEDLITKIAGN